MRLKLIAGILLLASLAGTFLYLEAQVPDHGVGCPVFKEGKSEEYVLCLFGRARGACLPNGVYQRLNRFCEYHCGISEMGFVRASIECETQESIK